MDSDFLVKRMILEQACYFCQHKIIQRFMPEDITTYNIHPLLPAMAALHQLVCSYYSDHDTGKAVTLLQYVHSLIPQPSSELQREYVDLLISLKTKASFYEIFTRDHSSSDNQYHMSILDKYFGHNSEPQCIGGEEEYSAEAHSTMRQTIMRLLDSESERKVFQLNVLLRNTKSKGMHEGLAENLEIYLNKVRNALPTPQLVMGYFGLQSELHGDSELESDCSADSASQGQPNQLPPCGKQQRVSVVLKNPQIILTRLVRPSTSGLLDSPPTSLLDRNVTDSQEEGNSLDEWDKGSKEELQASPRVCKTPAVAAGQEVGITKLDPKGHRVMGSIARKRKFLAGSPTTSSDDSSCSFLSLKKMRRDRSSFMSPEISLASSTGLGQKLSENNKDSDRMASPRSSAVKKRERKKKSNLLVHKKRKANPLEVQDFNLAQSSPHTSGSGDIVRRVYRNNSERQTMVHFADESDYVSESDCESPLQKNTPLYDLVETSRRIC